MARFRARARTVDMLGRQQVAGIPTALSELFKNAYDAYATRAEVDYLRKHRLLVLRDNGLGMTLEDVENRWLVVGTESKYIEDEAQAEPASAPPPNGMERRPVLGEKGIGRLAISTIGSAVLLVTRARRDGRLQNTVVALVAWGLFELPTVDLDDIEIPVRSVAGGAIPSRSLVEDMAEELRESVRRIAARVKSPRIGEVLEAVDQMSKVDPATLVERLESLAEPGLSLVDGSGSHFFVRPTEPLLNSDIDGDGSGVPVIVRILAGFTNTLVPTSTEVSFLPAFRDHPVDGSAPEERIGPAEFLTADDLESCDHVLRGAFDEYGTFRGSLRVFEKAYPIEFKPREEWNQASRVPGVFGFSFGYLQGEKPSSLLHRKDPAAYARLDARLAQLGGIYLYRDGVRILPYGGPENDWLHIEKRRSASASHYFFSHRRMIGAVLLSRANNPRLMEKAGREGFRENTEFRWMRMLIQDLLVGLAMQYFRKDSPSDAWRSQRAALVRNEKLRTRRDHGVRSQQREFGKALETALYSLSNDDITPALNNLLSRYEVEIREAVESAAPNDVAEAVGAAEQRALEELDGIVDGIRVQKPRGFGLTQQLRADWDVYTVKMAALDAGPVAQARARVREVTESVARQLRATFERRRVIADAVEQRSRRARKDTRAAIRQLEAAQEQLHASTGTLKQEVLTDLEALLAAREKDVRRAAEAQVPIGEALRNAEAAIAAAGISAVERTTSVADVMRNLAERIRSRDDDPAGVDTLGAIEEELIARREKEDSDAELLQLGMALEVIDHEFVETVKEVRAALRQLKPWGARNPALLTVHHRLAGAFAHLDAYLALFTPFHRRIYSDETVFAGQDIHRYLSSLFGERLARSGIVLEPTEAFLSRQIKGFPSTFYPVFVNLIDNATFWLRDWKGPKKILLAADTEGMLVIDTGPGVEERDRGLLFEPGFTRKPGGRGLGLHISREVLRKAGWRIELVEVPHSSGAAFKLTGSAAKAGGAT